MADKTEATQHVEVGAGVALGTLASGVDAITSNKMAVEFAFRSAWRSWIYASRFPQIKAGPPVDDIYVQIIGRSERRKFTYAAWRHEHPLLYPYVTMSSWTVDESLDALADSSDVAVSGWVDLATLFLGRLKDSEKFVYQDKEADG